MSFRWEGAARDIHQPSEVGAQRIPTLAKFALRGLFSALPAGHLIIETPAGRRIGHNGRLPGPQAIVKLHRWRLLAQMLLKGDIGFAESYMSGDWSSPDLVAVIELAARNRDAMTKVLRGRPLMRVLPRIRNLLRTNTRSRSSRNVKQHYDLGNAFYRLWLDGGMTYSSAIYQHPAQSLEMAQAAKLNRVMALLDLKRGQSILEIGCGWGGLAERLVSDHDCHVTGITLSPTQLAYANERLQRYRETGRVQLKLQDYRDAAGTYDRIVSIEMLEAVGERYWSTYFEKLRECLRPGGIVVLQVITIAKERFADYRAESDFIQQYIFPGGMLPTVDVVREHAEANGLGVKSVERFGGSYACTLRDWHLRFQRVWPAIHQQGFTPRFKRMWEYYLAYCEAGFRAGLLDVGLYRLVNKER